MLIEEQSIGWIARTIPGGFQQLDLCGIDVCCAGRRILKQVVDERGMEGAALYAHLSMLKGATAIIDWSTPARKKFVAALVDEYHTRHRQQLPILIDEAERVERIHRHHSECPHGITQVLMALTHDLGGHMLKEELILFPMLAHKTRVGQLVGPIAVVEDDHVEHLHLLGRAMTLTQRVCAPPDASGTWRRFYQHLYEFGRDLKFHIHLENNILFAL